MNDNDVVVYRYMDEKIKNIRENVLKNYLKNKEYDREQLNFVDLSIYDNGENFFGKVRKCMFKSEIDNDISLTKYQIEILKILDENNIFISAPTSFGKTFIMLEYIKRNTNILKNIIFIIPTLALMNELLKKIFNLFGNEYNICINNNEQVKEKNIFVFVPERSDNDFLKSIENMDIDLLIFDEIYKLQGGKSEVKRDDRLIYMNKIYLDLVNKAKKVALLGPYINNVEFNNTGLKVVKFFTNYMPVYNEIEMLQENEKWEDKINFNSELIYFKSPESIYKNIEKIIDKVPEDANYTQLYKNEIAYLDENIGDEWYVVKLLKRGIGIHHGKTPMYLRKFYESEYSKGKIRVLLCTNTLMEGINTPTESLIIVDNPGSSFKLNNLIGRVGRLNPKNPQIGKILICDKEILNNLVNTNSWLDLKIMAEEEEIVSDDEVLYLKKEYKDIKKKEVYEAEIRILQDKFNVSPEKMIKKNVEFLKTVKFFNDGLYEELLKCESIYKCTETTLKLMKSIAYRFDKRNFNNLDLKIQYLPYKVYICDILNGKKIKNMITEFNERFNHDKNIENINIFIDAIYELTNYIKFTFSKIINYIELAENVNLSDILKEFVSLITSYNNLEIAYKILDDLGISMEDAKKIIEIVSITNDTSASSIIKNIKEHKDAILSSDINPFSKNNIINM